MCPRDFNQKNSLDMHQRKHTGFKPHICQFCNLGFTQSGNLFLLCFLMCLNVLVNTLKTGCTNLMCPLKSILSWLNFTSKHATSLKSGFPKTKKSLVQWDVNTKPVWYFNGPKLFDHLMICYSGHQWPSVTQPMSWKKTFNCSLTENMHYLNVQYSDPPCNRMIKMCLVVDCSIFRCLVYNHLNTSQVFK